MYKSVVYDMVRMDEIILKIVHMDACMALRFGLISSIHESTYQLFCVLHFCIYIIFSIYLRSCFPPCLKFIVPMKDPRSIHPKALVLKNTNNITS